MQVKHCCQIISWLLYLLHFPDFLFLFFVTQLCPHLRGIKINSYETSYAFYTFVKITNINNYLECQFIIRFGKNSRERET
jgi:hypothetical protein